MIYFEESGVISRDVYDKLAGFKQNSRPGGIGTIMSDFSERYTKKAEALFTDILTGGNCASSAEDWTNSPWAGINPILTAKDALLFSRPEQDVLPPFNKPILESVLLTVTTQIRWPKCNKKKWAKVKRWAKNPKNFRVGPDPNLYITDAFITCHPATAEQLKKHINRL